MKKTTLASLFCAFLVVCSIISIPTPFGVPVTLQTFAVFLLGFCLPLKYSLFSYISYILLGVCGLPVFSFLSGGAGVLFGPTGGFLIGFIFIIIFCSMAQSKGFAVKILMGGIGLALCHALGIIFFALSTKTSILASALACSAPFIIKDILLLAVAVLVSKRIKRNL